MIAPDDTTFDYLRGRKFAPQGADFDAAVEKWRTLATDPGATYDTIVEIDASQLSPVVTWGTNPGMVAPVTGQVPDPASFAPPEDQYSAEKAVGDIG